MLLRLSPGCVIPEIIFQPPGTSARDSRSASERRATLAAELPGLELASELGQRAAVVVMLRVARVQAEPSAATSSSVRSRSSDCSGSCSTRPL